MKGGKQAYVLHFGTSEKFLSSGDPLRSAGYRSMLRCIARILAFALLPLGSAQVGAVEGAEIPELVVMQYMGEVHPRDATALVEVRIAAPEDELSGAEDLALARVEMYFQDDGIPFRLGLVGRQRGQFPIGSSFRIRVPCGRRIGVAAYCPDRGYDERLVGPLLAAEASESMVQEVVTLRLPARSEPGTVFSTISEQSANHRRSEPVKLSLHLPLTGLEIASSRWRDEGSLVASVPPGDYAFRSEPLVVYFCSEDFFRLPEFAEYEQSVRVQAGKRIDLTRPLERGVQLEARLSVADATESVVESIAKDAAYLVSDDFWYGGGRHTVPARWFVTAKAARFDEETGAFGRPMTIRWRQAGGDSTVEWTIAPVGGWIQSSMTLAPGRYRISIEGPLIQNATHELIVKANGRKPQPVEWEPRVQSAR